MFEGEPRVDPRLLALRNVVLTPHIASGSLATRRAMVSLAVDNLIAALGFGPNAGKPPQSDQRIKPGFRYPEKRGSVWELRLLRPKDPAAIPLRPPFKKGAEAYNQTHHKPE